MDRRSLALHVYSLFCSYRKIAFIIGVSHSTVGRWIKHPERKAYTRKSPKSLLIVETVKSAIKSNPFINARQLATIIQTVLNVSVSRELIRLAILKLGQTRKKAKFNTVTKTLEETTNTFLKDRDACIKANKYIVSLDETSFGRSGKAVYGYAPRGQPLKMPRNPPSGKATSVVVVIDNKKVVAKASILGAFNKLSFLSFLNKLTLPKSTVILLDNVRFHHSKEVKELAIFKEWELLYTPPYSPWFNPIEEAFSIIKRKYYQCWKIDESFQALKQHHCQAFFQHSMNQKLKEA